jgi:hypothetical protein
MHVHVFNVCLLLGWLLVLAGGVLMNVGAGLAAAGVLLIVLVLVASRVAGGLYVPERKEEA